MLYFKKGCKVPFPERISEGYEETSYGYIANISTEKILDVVKAFISIQKGSVFFFLELPTNISDEPEPEKYLHQDVYYMDNLSHDEAFSFLDSTGELLTNDGLCTFGFGSQENGDEIMVGKYNVVSFRCDKNASYINLFRNNNIEYTPGLITAWDTFSEDNPGICEKIEINGKTVFSIPKAFEKHGMYFAERREKS